MKNLLLAISVSGLLLGCSNTPRVEYVYVNSKCPTIPLNTFQEAHRTQYKAFKSKGNICMAPEEFKRLVGNVRRYRSEYNRLLQTVKSFNEEITILNQKQ